jgi:hypothetical protein
VLNPKRRRRCALPAHSKYFQSSAAPTFADLALFFAPQVINLDQAAANVDVNGASFFLQVCILKAGGLRMGLRNLSLAAVVIMVVSLSAGAKIAAYEQALTSQHVQPWIEQNADPITGEWTVTFYVHEMKTPATFTFKLDGAKLTGSAYSEHTGPGTIRDGKWADSKLSFTLDFAKHESIVVNGELKGNSLAGQFTTEGFTDKWEAIRK